MRVHLQNETEEMLVLHGNSEARADVPMFYRHSGQGPPLVWLHWLWGEPGWMPHHQQLAERFHVYAPDLPGYGQSTLPEWAHRPRDVAVLLLRFLDALSLEQPIVVASCLGGWVAAELAILRPERLARLVLISPLGLTQDWTQIPNLFYADPARLQLRLHFHPRSALSAYATRHARSLHVNTGCGNTALTNSSGLGLGMEGCSGQGAFYFDAAGLIRSKQGATTCLGLAGGIGPQVSPHRKLLAVSYLAGSCHNILNELNECGCRSSRKPAARAMAAYLRKPGSEGPCRPWPPHHLVCPQGSRNIRYFP